MFIVMAYRFNLISRVAPSLIVSMTLSGCYSVMPETMYCDEVVEASKPGTQVCHVAQVQQNHACYRDK